MRTAHAVAALMAVALANALAQPPARPGEPQLPLFIETFVMPSADSTTWELLLNYRIDREFFIPVRNSDASVDGQFRRTGEILLELSDTTGIPAGRQFKRIDITDEGAPPQTTERYWLEGSASFTIAPGSYRVFLEATDTESRRRQVKKDIVVRTPKNALGSLTISGAAFILPPRGERPDTLVFDNLGGDFLFGKTRALLVGVSLGQDTSSTASCRWTFRLRDRSKDDGHIQATDSSSTIPIIRHAPIEICGAGREASVLLRRQGNGGSSFLIVPLSTALLPLRDYVLQIDVAAASGQRASFSRPVRAVWPEMPFSLKDVEGAINALRFITTPRQLDSLRSGSYEQQRDALEGFWQSRNPNPASARNEVMAEYYRRVDYATRNYGTIRLPDGSRSDRGKIYILYGAPTRTERALNPAGAHMETWVYERLKKRCIFVDEERNGTYSLVTTTSQ